jgi:hypothetical protein
MATQPSYYSQAIQQQSHPIDTQVTEHNHNFVHQWSQQPTITNQSDALNNTLSQTVSTNSSYYQPIADQTQYIQPGFTSTPNPYPSSQVRQTTGQIETNDHLPVNEVCCS